LDSSDVQDRPLLFSVKAQQKLRLDFDFESNFKGTKLESRFPVTGKETVRVFVKQSCLAA